MPSKTMEITIHWKLETRMEGGFYQCKEESFQAHGTVVWFNEGESIACNVKDILLQISFSF
jgi:hypothetical protein